MPVLLLAQGDPEARTLLRQAIEARYGLQPPVIESLRIDFKGRARVKLGPISTWVPVDATAYFRFPTMMRWDFAVRPLGVPIRRGVDAFDGSNYRSSRGGSQPDVITDADRIHSARQRLWAIAGFLLTPMGEMFVKLASTGSSSFSATNTQLQDSVQLFMRPDHTLEHLQLDDCLNPDNDQRQKFFIHLSEEQTHIDGLMLPTKISTFWNDDPYYEVEPVKAQLNPEIADGVFTLEKP